MSREPIAISYGMILVAVAAVAGLTGMVWALKPKGGLDSKPPPAATVEPTEKPAVKASAGAMAFRDPENTQRYQQLQTSVALFQKKLDALPTSKTMPGGELDSACVDIAALANPLAGEAHPDIQKAADRAKRLCDYDRPIAVIRLALSLLKSGANKKETCNAAGRATNVLVEKKYGDDETVKLELANLGKACM